MPIKWREQMSVGNHTIDMDHRLLICKINMIELALQAPGEEMINLTVALDELEEYTKVHFKREEKLQTAMSYPKYDEHKFQHQELVNRLKEIREQILGINDSSRLAEKAPQLTKLLRDWLLEHVLTEDMKLKPYCAQYPVNYAP
jgi:hemerythrin